MADACAYNLLVLRTSKCETNRGWLIVKHNLILLLTNRFVPPLTFLCMQFTIKVKWKYDVKKNVPFIT